MKAYSLHDREVGYCQGSGFIVGLLLMQVHFNVWAGLEGYKRIIIKKRKKKKKTKKTWDKLHWVNERIK